MIPCAIGGARLTLKPRNNFIFIYLLFQKTYMIKSKSLTLDLTNSYLSYFDLNSSAFLFSIWLLISELVHLLSLICVSSAHTNQPVVYNTTMLIRSQLQFKYVFYQGHIRFGIQNCPSHTARESNLLCYLTCSYVEKILIFLKDVCAKVNAKISARIQNRLAVFEI